MAEDRGYKTGANIFGIKDAPPDFLNWAIQNGAISTESDTEWQALLARE